MTSIFNHFFHNSKVPPEANEFTVKNYEEFKVEEIKKDIKSKEEEEKVINEHSLLRKSSKPLKDFQPVDFIRNLAKTIISNPITPQVIQKRAEKFLKETEKLVEIQRSIEHAHNNIMDRDVLIERLANEHEENGVSWIPLDNNLLCRIDDKTISFVNTDETSLGLHQSVIYTENDPLDEGILYRKGIKTVKTFTHSTGKTLKGKIFFEVLLQHCFNRKNKTFFYESLPAFCELKEVSENDYSTHSERYRSLENNPSIHATLKAALFYSLNGIFEKSSTYTKEAANLFEIEFFHLSRLIFIRDLHLENLQNQEIRNSAQNKRLLEKVEGLTDECLALIKTSKKLFNEKACTSENNFRELYATYLDLKKYNEALLIKQEIFLKDESKLSLNAGLQNEHFEIKLNSSLPSLNRDPIYEEALQPHENLSVPDIVVPLNRVEELIQGTHPPANCQELVELLQKNYHCIESLKRACEDHCILMKDRFSKGLIAHPLRRTIPAENIHMLDQTFDHLLKEIVCSLPSPSRSKDAFWSTIPENQIKVVLKQLNQFGALLHELETVKSSLEKKGIDNPYLGILHYQILAITEVLARRSTKELENFQISHNTFFDFLRKPSLVLDCAELQKSVLDLARYFDPNFNYYKLVTEPKSTFEEIRKDFENSAMSLGKFLTNYAWQITSLEPLSFVAKPNSETYRFYKQFLDLESVQNRWSELGDKAPISEEDKILWLVEEAINGENILPDAVYALQRSVIHCTSHAYFRTLDTYAAPIRAIPKDISRRFFGQKDKTLGVFTHKLHSHPVSIAAEITDENLQSSFVRLKIAKSAYQPGHAFEVFNRSKNPLFSGGQNLLNSGNRGSLEDKALHLITCNPLDSLNRFLGFYSQNYKLMNKKANIDIFHDILFQFQNLETQIKYNPGIILRLNEFFEGSIEQAYIDHDFNSVLELSLLMNKVRNYLNERNLKDAFAQFTDPIRLINENLLLTAVKQEEYYSLNYVLLLLNKENSEDYYLNLAMMMITQGNNRRLPENLKIELYKALGASETLRQCVFQTISSTYKLGIFAEKIIFNPKTGCLISDKYTISLLQGCSKNNHEDTFYKFTNDKVIDFNYLSVLYGINCERFFPENYLDLFIISYDKYKIITLTPKDKSHNLPTYRIDKLSNIERNFNGKIQQLFTRDYHEAISKNYPKLFTSGSYAFWIDKNADASGNIDIIAEPIEDSPILLKGKIDHENITISEISLDHKILCDQNAVSPVLLNYLKNFDPLSKGIQFWKHKKEKRLEYIVFYGSKLSFTIDNQGYINSDQYHGFYLAENLSIPRLPINKPYISLIDKKQNIKYLVLTDEVDESGNLIFAEIDYMDGRFIGKNRLSQLWLAYLYIQDGSFKDAAGIISNVSRMTFLNHLEKKIIQRALEKCSQNDIHNIAIRLKIKLLIKDANVLLSDDTDLFFRKDYVSYLSQKYRVSGCELTQEEERHILRQLIKLYKFSYKDLLKFSDELLKSKKAITSLEISTLDEYFDLIINRNHLRIFKDRLNILEGSPKAELNVIPVLKELFIFKVDALDFNKLITWIEKNKLPNEEDYSNISVSETVPPSTQDIANRFFVYYEFLRNYATDKQRIDFAKSLNLILHEATPKVNALIYVLKNVCKYPSGKPALKTIYDSIQETKAALLQLKEITTKDSYWKRISASFYNCYSHIKLYLILYKCTKYNYITSKFTYISYISKAIFEEIHSWWNTKSKTQKIKASVSPWMKPFFHSNKGIKVEERDLLISSEYKKIVDAYFEKKITANPPIDNLLKNETLDNKRIQREEKNYDTYLSIHKEKVEYLFNSTPNELKRLIKDLKEKTQRQESDLKTERVFLLSQANRTLKENFLKSAVCSALHKNLTSQEMFTLFASASEEQFKAKTTFDSEEAFQSFLSALTDNYVRMSRNQQLLNAIKLLEKADNILIEDTKKIEREKYLNEAAACLLAEPAYKRSTGHKERIMLAQEVSLGLLIRDDQLEKVNEVFKEEKKNPELLVEAPFGWGKSKVFRILMNALKGDGEHLVINILPSSQEFTLADQLEQQMNLCFGKKITHLTASRETDFSLKQLKEIHDRLIENIKLGSDLAVRPETLQALELQMLTLCYNNQKNNPTEETLEKLKLYIKILRLIRVKGWGAIEEENEVLNNKNKLIFAVGERNLYSPRYANIVKMIFDCISKTPQLKDLFKLKENNQENITQNDFDTLFLPKIIDYFAELYSIEGQNKELFSQFLMSSPDKDIFKKSFEWAKGQENKDIYAFIKGLIHSCFPIACKGRINAKDGYGLSKLDKKLKVPIPYLAKDTPKETNKGPSQYFPDVALIRAFFYYFAVGLKQDDVQLLITQMDSKAKLEARGGSVDLTPTAKILAKFVEEAGLPPGKYKLSDIKGIRLKLLADALKNHEAAITYFVQHCVAQQIDIYPTSLESSVQNLRSMIPSSLSLSATPQHAASHGPTTKYIPMKGTAGGITHILLTKTGTAEEARLHVLRESDPIDAFNESVNEALIRLPDGAMCSAIVEASPTFVGITNGQAAEAIGKKIKNHEFFEGVLYCDEKDKTFKIYDPKTGSVQLLNGSSFEEEKLFKFYSPEDTFNTDWNSAINAYFKLIVGPNSTWDQIGQGAGRARLIHLLQKIKFEISESTLNKNFNGKSKITPLEMLTFLLSNSAINEAANNYISIIDQMDNEIRRAVLDKMFGLSGDPSYWPGNLKKEIDPQKALRVFGGSESIFITKSSQDPWTMYSGLQKGCKPPEELKNYQDDCIVKLQNTSLDYFEKRNLRKKLKEYEAKWNNSSGVSLPETVISNSGNQNAQIEITREIIRKKELDAGISTNSSQLIYKPDTYPPKLDLFKKGWELPSALKHTAYKVSNFAYEFFMKNMLVAAKATDVLYYAAMIANISALTCIILQVAEIVTLVATGVIFTFSLATTVSGFYCALNAIGVGISWLGRGVILRFTSYDMHYVKDVVRGAARKKTKKAAEMFDYNYVVTNNKLKVWSGMWGDSQEPFKANAKPLLQLLIIIDKENGKEKLTFVDTDQNDILYFASKLMEDNDKTSLEDASKRTRQIAVYDIEAEESKDPKSKFVLTGKNGIDIDKLLNNSAFHAGIAQAKLYNGCTKFTNPELYEVPKLVQKIYGDTIDNGIIAESFFTGDVLANKTMEERESYSKSPLSNLLNPSNAYVV